MAKKRKTSKLSEVLRDKLANDPRSIAAISRESGVNRASLVRFLNADRAMHLDLVDQLAEFYELILTERKR